MRLTSLDMRTGENSAVDAAHFLDELQGSLGRLDLVAISLEAAMDGGKLQENQSIPHCSLFP